MRSPPSMFISSKKQEGLCKSNFVKHRAEYNADYNAAICSYMQLYAATLALTIEHQATRKAGLALMKKLASAGYSLNAAVPLEKLALYSVEPSTGTDCRLSPN